MESTVCSLNELSSKIINGENMFHVRVIARLIGQLISMQSAMGPIVRLRSRSLYQCVLSRASWDAPVLVTSKAFDEI